MVDWLKETESLLVVQELFLRLLQHTTYTGQLHLDNRKLTVNMDQNTCMHDLPYESRYGNLNNWHYNNQAVYRTTLMFNTIIITLHSFIASYNPNYLFNLTIDYSKNFTTS